MPFSQLASDGSVLSWGTSDAPGPPLLVLPGAASPIAIAVMPVRPGHSVSVEFRVNGGPVLQTPAIPLPRVGDVSARLFKALIPGQENGLVEFMPVLRLAGQVLSPRLGESASPHSYQVRDGRTSPVATVTAVAPTPRWAYDMKFLGCLTATVRKEVVGAIPDGYRVDWHVVEGSFVGPGFQAKVLPGATDWMRIRQDGVGVVCVQACFETPGGARIYGEYGGRFDLGPNGYARAVRDEFDELPPVVVAPTYATADPKFAWLNRAQCVGVGRVDMRALRVEFDVYVVGVNGRIPEGVVNRTS